MKKDKKELFEKARQLSELHKQKKEAIENIFSDLDKEDKVSTKHLGGISAVNELLKEIDALEKEHSEVLEQIKEN